MPVNFAVKAAVTVALTAANMALTMTRKIEGPRLDELKFSGGDYGAPLPMIWGLRRMDVPIFWAEDLREVKRRRKTKGGKFNEYTYYGTWAVALAGHEIEGVRRIWFDTHLVYDLSGAGPVTPFDFGDNATGSIADYITIYTGTETQLPDPRMEATVEAEFGEGSCPAYRGTAYVVFKDIPLEKLGNRIPQVSVEILGKASAFWPVEEVGTTGVSEINFSPNREIIVTRFLDSFQYVDVASRTAFASGIRNPVNGAATPNIAVNENGQFYGQELDNAHVYLYDANGIGTLVLDDVAASYDHFRSFTTPNGTFYWVGFDRIAASGIYVINGSNETTPEAGVFRGAFADLDNNVWVCGYSDDTTLKFFRVRGSGGVAALTISGLPARTGIQEPAGAIHYRDETRDQFVFWWADSLFAIDRTTGAINYSYTAAAVAEIGASSLRPGGATVWAGTREFSLADLSVIRALPVSTWGLGGSSLVAKTDYVPALNALATIVNNRLAFLYLDRVSPGELLLSEICADVAGDCGVLEYDFTDLTQVVTGWSATRGQGSSILEPLLDAYDSDIRPHDFTIEGLKRTGTATGTTLGTERFVGEPRYAVSIRQSSELPRAMIIDFADIDADQQPNSVRSDRPLDATDARGEKKIDLTTLALDADAARGLADRHFRRIWNERKGISLGLTAEVLALEPGDVRTLSLDGQEVVARCIRVKVGADDVLATEWRYDSPSLALLNGATGASFDGRAPSVVVVPLYSKGFVLDIPLLSDSDETTVPQVYTLAAPFADGIWPGASIFQAVDGEFSDELATVPTSGAATWGNVAGVMPYANPNLWDRGTEITVTLQTGELTGCTEAAANADPTLNLAAIGNNGRWEIVQFTTATLTTGTTYTVSGFKRGRRGTEWAAELHAVGDSFVLLDTADAQVMGLSEVATAVAFKAITAGRSSGFEFGYTYEGQTLKPYAPAHLSAVKEASGDWTIDAIRRTRVGGDWRGNATIPLGETSESYRVTVGDGVTSVNKTTASLPYTWTVAAQTTDTGAEVMAGDLEYAVAQISAAVGVGFVAEATA